MKGRTALEAPRYGLCPARDDRGSSQEFLDFLPHPTDFLAATLEVRLLISDRALPVLEAPLQRVQFPTEGLQPNPLSLCGLVLPLQFRRRGSQSLLLLGERFAFFRERPGHERLDCRFLAGDALPFSFEVL